jgi:hypothetical protein
VSRRLREIPAQIRERFDLSDDQVSGIEQKLDDLIDASQRVGRKDWLVLLYGAAWGMVVNDSVPPHVVQSIITTVVTSLGLNDGLITREEFDQFKAKLLEG